MEYEESSDEDDIEQQKKRCSVKERINFAIEGTDFKMMFRVSPGLADYLLSRVGSYMKNKTTKNHSLTPKEAILSCLDYMGRGGLLSQAGTSHGFHKSTACRYMKRFVTAVNEELLTEFIRFPVQKAEMELVKAQFYEQYGMPRVMGLIDGTLVKILAPMEAEADFVDRHHNHSINVLLVCGPNYEFYYVNASMPGSVHDARVLRRSTLYDRFETTNWRPAGCEKSVLLGDSGFPCLPWLINPIIRGDCTPQQMRFNDAHRKTRSAVERAIGLLKQSWLCLQFLRHDPVYAANIIQCCCVLHNLIRKHDQPTVQDDTALLPAEVPTLIDPNIEESDVEEDIDVPEQSVKDGKIVRNELVTFFKA